MLYEIIALTTITSYSTLYPYEKEKNKKSIEETYLEKEIKRNIIKQKILNLSFHIFTYFGLYELTKNTTPIIHDDYLFLTPMLFGIATITNILRQKETKSLEKKLAGKKLKSLEELTK